MDYMVFNTTFYKREDLYMGNGKKKKSKDDIEQKIDLNNQEEEILNNEKVFASKKSLKKVIEISMGGVIGIIVTVAVSAVAASWIISSRISAVESNISAAQENISHINNDISELKNDMSSLTNVVDDLQIEMTKTTEYHKNVDKHFEYIDKILSMPVLTASNNIIQYVGGVSISKNNVNIVTSPLTSDTIIGSDSDGNEYIAEELINQTILLSYNENGKEVYFLGQYSEDYKWTGYCVTNAYTSEGILYDICESNFDNGKRLDYKSLVYRSEEGDWLYSNRTIDGDVNIGTNMHYIINDIKIKNFTKTNVRISDIFYVDKFLDTVDSTMTEFYSGNTSDSGDPPESKFNDTSGNAYRVKYDTDGTVLKLYVGNFVDGNYYDHNEDDSEDAWEILYVKENSTYYYLQGAFEGGSYIGDEYIPVTIDEINDIVSKYNFKCELKWKQ